MTTIDRRRVARNFGRAAADYDRVAALQRSLTQWVAVAELPPFPAMNIVAPRSRAPRMVSTTAGTVVDGRTTPSVVGDDTSAACAYETWN